MPKSRNATVPSSSQHVVAGVRVRVEVVELVDRAEVEAEHDLREAVALLLVQLLHLLEARCRWTYSVTSTLSRDRRVTTSGTWMNGWPR